MADDTKPLTVEEARFALTAWLTSHDGLPAIDALIAAVRAEERAHANCAQSWCGSPFCPHYDGDHTSIQQSHQKLR